MIHSKKKGMDTKTMVMGAVMTALVIVFQLISTYTTFFGPFSTAMALIPIVIGTALCGVTVGGWLGFVFGMAVIISGDAAAFLVVNPLGTVLTVLVKGIAAGLAVNRETVLLLERLHSRFGAGTKIAVNSNRRNFIIEFSGYIQ